MEEQLMKRLIDNLMSNGGDFADIYVERSHSLGISLENRKIEKITRGERQGVGLRVLYGDRTYFAFSEDFSPKVLEELSVALSRKQQADSIHLPQPHAFRECLMDCRYKGEGGPGSLEEKISFLRRMNDYGWENGKELNQLSMSYGEIVKDITLMNSQGIYMKEERPRVKTILQGIFSRDGVMQSAYDAMGALGDFSFLRKRNPEEFAEQVLKKGEALLRAEPAPSGTMTVVISGEAGGTMVHEACGHGLEADIVEKGMSVYGGHLGEQVASPLITVVDDGTIPGRYGSGCFDDEGTPTRENTLIENGILKGYMSDLLSARKLGLEPSGNGRREDYRSLPITRMTNTYIASGKTPPEEILSSVKEGLLVKKMGGGQVNTATGDFVFEVSEGYLIHNGRPGPQVRGATLIGNGPEVLRKIDAVGSDFGYSLGTCGKDGQGVPVADGQPTLRIPSLIVGGTR